MEYLYSPRMLYREPYFVASLILSVMVAAVFVVTVGIFLGQNKLYIEPIADLRVVPDASGTNKIEPISKILNFTPNSNADNKPLVSGYLANLRDVCEYDDNSNVQNRFEYLVKPLLVLIKTNEGFTAGITIINHKTCNIIRKINNQPVYLVSDIPFHWRTSDLANQLDKEFVMKVEVFKGGR